MKIGIIGGAGFIGSNLCEFYAKQGHEVHSLDNYYNGKLENHVDGVVYHTGNAEHVSRYLPKDTDILFHFGEYSRVEQSFEDMDVCFELNGQIKSVIDFCLQNDIKLIYSGSSSAFVENYLQSPVNLSPYTMTKIHNTQKINAIGSWRKDLDYAIVYFYNVYGPRECGTGPMSTLIASWAYRMANDLHLTVTGDGLQARNFTHVYDVIDALDKVALRGYGDFYGIGSDDSFSVLDVAKAFGGEIIHREDVRGNRRTARLDTERTKMLGWNPTRHLYDYIEELRNNNWKN